MAHPTNASSTPTRWTTFCTALTSWFAFITTPRTALPTLSTRIAARFCTRRVRVTTGFTFTRTLTFRLDDQLFTLRTPGAYHIGFAFAAGLNLPTDTRATRWST